MRLSLVLIAISACLLGFNALAYDPRDEWTTLKTPHFTIHYPAARAALARNAAVLAERVHAELVPRLDWLPLQPTEIILADDSDLANGRASPFPYNQIHLIVTPPEPGGFMEVSDENEWLYQLIRHEYVHILHLDAATGFPGKLQQIFGRQWFAFPALFQPAWVIEGLATDMETDATRGAGRGVGSDMAMRMRTEVMHGIKPLQQVSLQMMDSWPRAYAAYIYGEHFFQFLRERYGSEAALRMLRGYRSNFVPFRIDASARLATGKRNTDMYQLWAEFQQWLEARYHPQIAAITAAGLAEGEQLTHGGQLQGDSSVQATADGSVYYVRNSITDTAALMRRSPDGQHHEVSSVHALARFDIHPVAGIVLAQPELCGNERVYYDLYLLPPNASSPKRLTHCARYRNVAWRADGKALFAVREEGGRSRIDQLQADGILQQTLWSAPVGERATHIAASPDGRSLVFVHSQTGKGSNLVLLDINSRQLAVLTRDRNSEVLPRFSPDGSAVLFSSDHGGVSNLRRLDLASGTVSTLSNTLSGAFAPSQAMPGGPIWFTRYTAQGNDLARLDAPLAAPLPAPASDDPDPIRIDATLPAPSSAPYRPWSSLRPRGWLPIIEADNARTVLGLMTDGSDALAVHRYSVALARDLRNASWVGGFSYSLWDRMVLGVARTQELRSSDNKTVGIRNVDTAALGLQLPWLRWQQRMALTGGLVWERSSEQWHAAGWSPQPERRDGVAGVAASLDTTQLIADAAGPSAGRRLQLSWETSNALGHSDYRGHTAAGDWREYINIGSGRVLAAHLSMARGSSGIQPYALGGSFNEFGAAAALPFNQRDIDLRSYDDGSLFGHAYQLATVELRSPLWSVDRTFTRPPLGLTHVHGTVFAESARALQVEWSDWHSGVGTELVSQVVLGYLLPLDLRTGLAWGMRQDGDGGGLRAYLSLGYGF